MGPKPADIKGKKPRASVKPAESPFAPVLNDIYTCVVYGLLCEADLRKAVPSILATFHCDSVTHFATSHPNLLEFNLTEAAALTIIARNEQGRIGLREFRRTCIRYRPKVELSMEAAVTRISSYFRMFKQRSLYRLSLSSELAFLGISKESVLLPKSVNKLIFEKLLKVESAESDAFDLRRSKMVALVSSLTFEWETEKLPAIRSGIWRFKEINGRFPDSIPQVEELMKKGDFFVPLKKDQKKNKKEKTVIPIRNNVGLWKTISELDRLLDFWEPIFFSKKDEEEIFFIFHQKMIQKLENELMELKGVIMEVMESTVSDSFLRTCQQDFIDLVKLGIVQSVKTDRGYDDYLVPYDVLASVRSSRSGAPPKSLVLTGPPGCGKSSLAVYIASLIGPFLLYVSDTSIPIEKVLNVISVYGPVVVLIENNHELILSKLGNVFSISIGETESTGRIEIPVLPMDLTVRKRFIESKNGPKWLASVIEGFATVDICRILDSPLTVNIDTVSRIKCLTFAKPFLKKTKTKS